MRTWKFSNIYLRITILVSYMIRAWVYGTRLSKSEGICARKFLHSQDGPDLQSLLLDLSTLLCWPKESRSLIDDLYGVNYLVIILFLVIIHSCNVINEAIALPGLLFGIATKFFIFVLQRDVMRGFTEALWLQG